MQKLLDETELLEWVKRRLGFPLLKVPLTPEHLGDALAASKHWFAAKKGIDKDITMYLASGQVEYIMPNDCDAVIDVSFESSQLDVSLVLQPNVIGDEQVPYNVCAPPAAGAGGLYSTFVQSLQYVKMAKSIMGADRKWLYFPYKKILLLLPPVTGMAIIEYKSNVIQSIDQLPERDHDLIKRYSLAWAKRDLGAIYSRYASWPSAQGQSVLNGPQLTAEADKEFTILEEEIGLSAMPLPFLIG